MPYYTISWNQTNENVANNYNKYIVSDLLRTKYGYDGVVCTDWSVTGDHRAMDVFIDGKVWGVENLTMAERHYKILMAGADQFGGNNDMKPIIEAYAMGVKEHGEAKMRARMEQSAVRLLRNIFQVGLFENPYVNPEETKQTVGKPEYMQAGFQAQLQSIVLLKNKANVLPIKDKKTLYIPKRFVAASRHFLGFPIPASNDFPINMELVQKYFNITDDASKADIALVCIENPKSGIGYDKEDVAKGGNGYLPISLQYNDYTANEAREVSIAGGDPLENFTNRSYKGKSVKSRNVTDIQLIEETKAKMNGKPVIVSVNVSNPMVFAEFEGKADAILASFGVQDQAILEILAGKAEPQALLPMQMPANMSVVEKQKEDVPFDMECHVDSEGHRYDFGFGMNWKGVIQDARTKQFSAGGRQ
jgi:beta-glucosidase